MCSQYTSNIFSFFGVICSMKWLLNVINLSFIVHRSRLLVYSNNTGEISSDIPPAICEIICNLEASNLSLLYKPITIAGTFQLNQLKTFTPVANSANKALFD